MWKWYEVPSLHRRYPVPAVLRTSPPPQGAQPVPHGPPVGHRCPRLGASRVACAFLVYMPPPIPRCSSWAYSSLISPSHFSLPRYGRRVGLHIVLFEACSAFTRVAACTLALSPIRDTLIEGFSHFVTSMTAPIASGWSGLHPLESAAFARRTPGTDIRLQRHAFQIRGLVWPDHDDASNPKTLFRRYEQS